MSTRLRDENTINAPGNIKKTTKKPNENNLSITRPTLASSAKVKPELKSKVSRTVLAPLSKSNPNATPKSKFILSETTKSKPLAPKLGPTRSINPLQTPKPIKKVLPKSTKKGLSIYTPAWQDLQQEKEEGIEEVEHSHPKPLGLEDGPPTPIRDAFLAVADVLEGDLDPTEIDDPNWDDNFGLTLDNPASPPRP